MIRVRRESDVVRVTLDRPECRNALSLKLLVKLREALVGSAIAGATAAVIDAAGPVFSAGADLSDLSGTSADIAMDDAIAAVVSAIRATDIPVIAAIDGPCIGGAVDIMLACDIRVASKNAWFQVPATRLGLLYNPAAVARMHALLRRDALMRLLISGERFDARQALAAGLVTHADTSTDTTDIVANETPAPENAGVAVAATKDLLNALDAGNYDPIEWERRRRELLDSPQRAAAIASAKREGIN